MREAGSGPAVVLLHGGWGYCAYPFDRQMSGLSERCRVVAPDRVGYGGSERIPELPDGFHRAMAEETALTLDALGIDRAALWGHSDGAVVAAWFAILFPARARALVLEAFHFAGGRAWLRIIEEGRRGRVDLFDGRLGEVRCPTLFLHGERDPRTEPGELESAVRTIRGARLELLDAGHSPHTSAEAAERTTALAIDLLEAAEAAERPGAS